jgi:hypothetical protein
MERLDGLLGKVAARVDPARGRALLLRARWRGVAGRALAERTRVRAAGVDVVVTVADARWAREVEGLRPVLARRLEAALGGVGEVRVEVGDVPSLPPPRPAPRPPRGRVAAGLGAAAARIGDDRLRARLLEVAACYLEADRERRA